MTPRFEEFPGLGEPDQVEFRSTQSVLELVSAASWLGDLRLIIFTSRSLSFPHL